MESDGEPFGTRLAELERTGGNVLVVADSPTEQLCQQLLGNDSRTRLLVTTDAATAQGRIESTEWQHVVEDVTDLSSLAYEIHQQFENLPDRDVRMCFDSLDPFIDQVDEQLLFRFLHVLTNRLKTAEAVAHYHLSPDVDDRTRNLYQPLFDVVLEP